MFVILSGCNTNRLNANKTADHLAKKQSFTQKLVKGGDFWITTYEKITDSDSPFVIYIEGEGEIIPNKYFVSENPTPTRPMFINLAFADHRPNVVYLARLCQYTPMELNPKCNNQYWNDKRYSEETVAAMNEAINKITQGKRFDLVGFSGGGGIAVLVAARNNKVNSILTIAANLDIDEFAKYHKTRPIVGSLNPIDYADNVKHIPQIHFSGAKDKVVPPFIGENFVNKINTGCARHEIIPQAEHNSYWNKVWSYILSSKMVCLKPAKN
jgi:hypothetical protein